MIAYHDNDIPKAQEMLEISENFYPISNITSYIGDPEIRFPTSFTQYYLALIQRDYGSIKEAQDYIDLSFQVHGASEATFNELLTPIVMAEIHFYNNDIIKTREIIEDILLRIKNLKNTQQLKEREKNYEARTLVLYGDTYYLSNELVEAEEKYKLAIESNDQYYFAYHSLGQVYFQQGLIERAEECFDVAFSRLDNSNDLKTKLSRNTLILLNALAFYCSKKKDIVIAKRYRDNVLNIFDKIKKFNGFEFKPYSLIMKKPITIKNYVDDLFEE